jgi:hypothetical protein
LWTRIIRHGERRTVLILPENLVTTLMEGIERDMLYGHEGQFETNVLV